MEEIHTQTQEIHVSVLIQEKEKIHCIDDKCGHHASDENIPDSPASDMHHDDTSDLSTGPSDELLSDLSENHQQDPMYMSSENHSMIAGASKEDVQEIIAIESENKMKDDYTEDLKLCQELATYGGRQTRSKNKQNSSMSSKKRKHSNISPEEKARLKEEEKKQKLLKAYGIEPAEGVDLDDAIKKILQSDYEQYNCGVCEGLATEAITCDGDCLRSFDLPCVGLKEVPKGEAWYCKDCENEEHVCKICCIRGKVGEDVFQCAEPACPEFVHIECAKKNPYADYKEMGQKNVIQVSCSYHRCHSCGERGSTHPEQRNKWLTRCIRCQVALHERCMTQKSMILQGLFMICDTSVHKVKPTTDKNVDDMEIERQMNDCQPITIFPAESKFFRSDLPKPVTWTPTTGEFTLPQIWAPAAKPKPLEAFREGFQLIRANQYNEEFVRRPSHRIGEQCNCDPTDNCGESCANRMMYEECSRKCVCGDRCTNQRLSRRQYAKVKVVATEDRGFGLYATEPIPSGALIIEYVGEVINMAECARRLDLLKTAEKKDFYMFKVDRDLIIDASLKGNYCRFANHSCDPNAKMDLWTVGAQQRLGLFASRDIPAGKEITYDYCCEGFWEKGEEPKCLCGSLNCRGYLGTRRDSKPVRGRKSKKSSVALEEIIEKVEVSVSNQQNEEMRKEVIEIECTDNAILEISNESLPMKEEVFMKKEETLIEQTKLASINGC